MTTRYRLKPTLKFSTFDPVVPPFPGQSAADSLAGEDESRSQHHATKPKDYPSSHYDKEDRPSNKRKNKGIVRKFEELNLENNNSSSSIIPSAAEAIAADISTMSLSSSSSSITPPPPQITSARPSVSLPKKLNPNYFLGLRLTCPILQQHITTMQKNILLRAPHLKKCFTSIHKLHLTFFVFHISSQNTETNPLEIAKNCLLNCQEKISTMIASYISQLSVTFHSLGNFGTNVLYISPQENEILQLLREINYYLADEFHRIGLFDQKGMSKVNHWNPHLTIAKTSADRRNMKKLSIKRIDYENCTDIFDQGKTIQVNFDRIDLLSMAEREEDGYYKSYGTIYLK